MPQCRERGRSSWTCGCRRPRRTDVPAVVFLHGGGWRLGSRHGAGPAYAGTSPNPFELVAQAGIAVASVDYRLSGEATFPAHCMTRRPRSAGCGHGPARSESIPDAIAAWGESAGGHLAELLGLTAGDETLDGVIGVTGQSSAVSAVVAWYAPSDIAAVATDAGTDPLDPPRGKPSCWARAAASVPDLAALASPISHVTAGAPPILLLHGRADRLIPCRAERAPARRTGRGRRRRRPAPVRRRRSHVARLDRKQRPMRCSGRSPSSTSHLDTDGDRP